MPVLCSPAPFLVPCSLFPVIVTGRFIVFEGLDGAGTSTQLELLAAWLREQGIDVETTREPSTGPLGR